MQFGAVFLSESPPVSSSWKANCRVIPIQIVTHKSVFFVSPHMCRKWARVWVCVCFSDLFSIALFGRVEQDAS